MERAATARKVRFSQSILYRLDQLVGRIVKAAEIRLREVSGMSFSQFLVLSAILELNECKQAQIARYAGVTPAVITKQVEELAGQGLLRLGPAHNDRRANVVSLTAKGRAMTLKLVKEVDAIWAAETKFPDHYRSKLGHWLDLQ